MRLTGCFLHSGIQQAEHFLCGVNDRQGDLSEESLFEIGEVGAAKHQRLCTQRLIPVHKLRQTAVENGLPAHSPEVEVVICLVTIMMAGAVESWLRGELTQTPEELTRRIDMMFQDYIRGVALRLKAPAAVYA